MDCLHTRHAALKHDIYELTGVCSRMVVFCVRTLVVQYVLHVYDLTVFYKKFNSFPGPTLNSSVPVFVNL
jgi:hypothetical protein